MAIYDIDGNDVETAHALNGDFTSVAYDVYGNKVLNHDIEKYRNYSISPMSWTAYGGLQGFAYYDGCLVMCTDEDYLKIADVNTGALLGGYTADVGHGNSIIFTDEFYDSTDRFPLLMGGGSYKRITLQSATVVGTYSIQPTVESNSPFGIGVDGRWFYTIGYTSGSYQYSPTNRIVLAKYDRQTLIDNKYALVHEASRDWFECIQGSCVHDGFFWVTSGITSPGHVYAIDLSTAEILLDIPMAEYSTYEIEGCTWKNDYTLIVGLRQAGSNKGMFTVTFPDIEVEII